MKQKKTIGVLGGSFDPVHQGHKQIAEIAIKQCYMDEIWFLLSLQNPLKQQSHPFHERLQNLQFFLQHEKQMIGCGLEKYFKDFNYTVLVLQKLSLSFPDYFFIWLMGTDELLHIIRWYHWNELFSNYTVMIFNRPNYDIYLQDFRQNPIIKDHEISLNTMQNALHYHHYDSIKGYWAYNHEPNVHESSTQHKHLFINSTNY